MLRRQSILVAVLLCAASMLVAHQLFFKLDRYFVPPHTQVRLTILNGTFQRSENAITRDRVRDISVLTAAGRLHLDTTAWLPGDDSTATLMVRTGEPGTYVVGTSTRPSEIDLTAAEFNEYLEHDGIPDILALRREKREMGKPARERYHKHIKTVFQVGDRRTDGFDVPLGYPAELVPIDNPYRLTVGSRIRVRALVDGRPVANQPVFAGGENGEGAFEERAARTAADGSVSFMLERPGKWYVRFIRMEPSPEPGLDYESKWATLTFAIR
jgi:hypothetical protein